MEQISTEQISLFAEDNAPETINNTMTTKIDVVKMKYEYAESVIWQDLFSGFDSICAITFSSSIGFINQLLNLFDTAEIIFGCETVMSYSLQEIMAYQDRLIERIRKNISKSKSNLLEKIDSGKVMFFVARKQISHEKLYLLSSKNGKKRVIMGSANMSYNAFSGRQRENICYMDDEEAYNWYYDIYTNLKENSTDKITHTAIVKSNLQENIEELPISQTLSKQKAIVIETCQENTEDIEFILDVQNLAKKLTPMLPKQNKTNGRIMISPETILKLKKHIKDDTIKQKEQRSEYPQFCIDVFKTQAILNGEILDLNPDNSLIEKDVSLFLRYMEGYKRFHGDYLSMQYRYFEFANWFFCSPFMAVMRDMASRYDQNRLPYPVFGLLYGQSKAGKTSFLETLLKMMIGQKPKIAAKDFTRTAIEALKYTVKGAPIIIDDMVNSRFNQHAVETIKNDDFGINEHLTNYSAVVISANEDVKAVSPEITRRTVICRVEAGLTNTETMKSNIVRSVQKEIGTAFYREYLRRMFDVMPDLIEAIKSDESESAPDILKYSSEIIVSIISNYFNVPEYIRPLSLDNYFSEQVTGKYAIKIISSAWRTSKKSFNINRKNNELCYNTGATYEADRIIKELPETLEAHKVGEQIIMKLDIAKEFFGINFHKKFFS